MPRVAGRVATRRKQRERSEPKKAAKSRLPSLEERIAEAEQEKIKLEQRVTKAFKRNDTTEGRRAARQLQRLEAQIEDLYEKWVAEGS